MMPLSRSNPCQSRAAEGTVAAPRPYPRGREHTAVGNKESKENKGSKKDEKEKTFDEKKRGPSKTRRETRGAWTVHQPLPVQETDLAEYEKTLQNVSPIIQK